MLAKKIRKPPRRGLHPLKRYMLCMECGDIRQLINHLELVRCCCGESESILIHPLYMVVGVRGRADVLEQKWYEGTRPGPSGITLLPVDKDIFRLKPGQTGFVTYFRIDKERRRLKVV